MANTGLAKYQVAVFFALAYAITWPAHFNGYTYATRHGHVPTNEGNVLSVAAWLLGWGLWGVWTGGMAALMAIRLATIVWRLRTGRWASQAVAS
jgi:hypothetical protein